MPRKINGFITLHRQILDWEWYKNINTKVLFLHLLLKANYKDLSFEGHKILRGQLVTSLPSLSSELGLSIHQIRVSLDKLIMTGEVASKSYNRYRVITIVKYDEYQNDDSKDGSQVADELTGKWQTDGSQVAGRWQADGSQMAASKQYNNSNKGTMEQGNNVKERGKTAKQFVPPSLEEVSEYIKEIGADIDPQYFIDFNQMRGWKLKSGQKISDWKACVRTWVSKEKKEQAPVQKQRRILPAQDFQQRDYSGVQDDMMSSLAKEMAAFKATGKVDM